MPLSYNPDPPAELLGNEKSILAIYTALNALTPTQKGLVWADFISGSPAKWSLDDGAHAGEVAVASGLAIDMPVAGAWTAALQTVARLKMVAIYLLDRPLYLKNPAFDPTIEVLPYTP